MFTNTIDDGAKPLNQKLTKSIPEDAESVGVFT